MTKSALEFVKEGPSFTVVDAGCRNGFTDLRGLHDNIHFIGFDPAVTIQKPSVKFLSEKFFPFGLYSSSGTFNFFECAHPSMSSMLEVDEALFLAHFGLMNNSKEWLNQLKLTSRSSIKTQTLDELAVQEKTTAIDFLKLDTQGTELMILQGAKQLLKERRIKLIKCEVAFVSVYKGQSLFHELASYLYTFGYKLAELQVYPEAKYQHGAAAIELSNFKEQIRYASGGDALFYLDIDLSAKEALIMGLMLASEGIFSLSFQQLTQAGLAQTEIIKLFEYFKKQKHTSGPSRIRALLKQQINAIKNSDL
ncbi:MAG: FkbM family methyltransferase [Bacteroidetes bacterium]|nr:FkbM family methyltransferase [Bacteroidota bacterium]